MYDKAELYNKTEKTSSSSHKDLHNNRMSIGQISKMSKVSVRSIRHYCEIELIKPLFIDSTTKYRYFSYEQITTLLLIKDMRELGFSLHQIDKVLHNGDLSSNISIVDEKINQTHIEIKLLEEKKKKLLNLNTMLKNIHSEASNTISYEIKEIPERTFLLYETNDNKTDGLAYLNAYEKIFHYAKNLGYETKEQLVSFLPSLNFNTFATNNMRYGIELCNENFTLMNMDKKGFELYFLKKGLYACMSYRGDYKQLYVDGYHSFITWLETQNLTFENKIVEIYHITRPFDTMSEFPLTEVQVKLI